MNTVMTRCTNPHFIPFCFCIRDVTTIDVVFDQKEDALANRTRTSARTITFPDGPFGHAKNYCNDQKNANRSATFLATTSLSVFRI
jgi:hypothetical protein